MHYYLLVLLLVTTTGCLTTKNKPPVSHTFQKNEEFEDQVKINEVPSAQPTDSMAKDLLKESGVSIKDTIHVPIIEKSDMKIQKKSKKEKQKKLQEKDVVKSKEYLKTKPPTEKTETTLPKVRQPVYEDNVGFEMGSRRPIKDPFRVNEKVVLDCSYLGATVGSLTLEVLPYVEVNSRKSYRWVGRLRTNDFFSRIFLVDDSMEVMSDYETLVPTAYRVHVKESKQLKESRAFYKADTNEATYWEKRWTEKDGDTDKKQKWIMEPYSQNYFSTLFYMRVFKYEVGKDYMFMLSENEKNTKYKNTVVRKEKLETSVGTFNTLVLKPQIEADGAYKPVGDSYMWVTDDDRKMILKVEAALKFGTLVFEVKSIDFGLQ